MLKLDAGMMIVQSLVQHGLHDQALIGVSAVAQFVPLCPDHAVRGNSGIVPQLQGQLPVFALSKCKPLVLFETSLQEAAMLSVLLIIALS